MTDFAVTLIDGPSGSGKTTLAAQLAAATGQRLLHLDDWYPGWGGLAVGSAMVADDVLTRRGYRTWDWAQQQPGHWVDLDPWEPTIIEGVGACTPRNYATAMRLYGSCAVVLLTAPSKVRKQRALTRDPEYAPWWDFWAAQERLHYHQMLLG